MTAKGVKITVSAKALADAGISPGDVVWAKAVRNSPLRNTPRYQMVRDRVRSFIQGHQNGLVTAGS